MSNAIHSQELLLDGKYYSISIQELRGDIWLRVSLPIRTLSFNLSVGMNSRLYSQIAPFDDFSEQMRLDLI